MAFVYDDKDSFIGPDSPKLLSPPPAVFRVATETFVVDNYALAFPIELDMFLYLFSPDPHGFLRADDEEDFGFALVDNGERNQRLPCTLFSQESESGVS